MISSVRYLAITFLFISTPIFAQTKPLWRAHAHNDYEHEQPLQEALLRGIGSVEVDIHLVDDALLVAHDLDQVSPEKSLQKLYLDPLRTQILKNGGQVYAEKGSLTLLIDIKSDAETTYRVLGRMLAAYDDILTRFVEGRVEQGAVTVIISGNRPRETMLAENVRWAAYDGRLEDLGHLQEIPVSFMPLVSSNWMQISRWLGEGEMPASDKEKLVQTVKKAQDEGRKIRFWATTDNTRVWEVLYEAGVDYLNADNLESVQQFLLEK